MESLAHCDMTAAHIPSGSELSPTTLIALSAATTPCHWLLLQACTRLSAIGDEPLSKWVIKLLCSVEFVGLHELFPAWLSPACGGHILINRLQALTGQGER